MRTRVFFIFFVGSDREHKKNKTKKREEREMPAGCFEGKKGKKIKNLNETRPPPHETDIKTLKKLSDDD